MLYDAIIIGTGPAGLSAALNLQIHRKSFLWLGSPTLSDKVAKAEHIANYPGLPGLSGRDLNAAFLAQVKDAGLTVTDRMVGSIMPMGQRYAVLAGSDFYETRTILLATGAEHAHLGVLGEEEFAGRGVSYCATCDGAFFRGKTVAVVGGGDVALEDAIYLSRFCQKVYLIHRRDELRGARILQEELFLKENVEILYSHTVQEIQGNDQVSGVILQNVKPVCIRCCLWMAFLLQ